MKYQVILVFCVHINDANIKSVDVYLLVAQNDLPEAIIFVSKHLDVAITNI
jgi:hypothetical protein